MRRKTIPKQQIINISYDIFCKKGIDYLTARKISNIGKFSTFPIYYNFSSINELHDAIIDKILEQINDHFQYMSFQNIAQFNFEFMEFIQDKPGIGLSFFENRYFYQKLNQELEKICKITLLERPKAEILDYNLSFIFSICAYFGYTNYSSEKAHVMLQIIMNSFATY